MTTACDLTARRCRPCEGGIPALTADEAGNLMRALDAGWKLAADGKSISRVFTFADYRRTIGFVNAVAWIADAEDHHPDLEVHYGRCTVRWWTHAIAGLSENDFICAAKVDRLLG